MRNKKYTFIITLVIALVPAISYGALEGAKSLLEALRGLVNSSIPVVWGLAFIFFFWGVAQFILHSGDQKTRDEGKKKMLWGVIALFVMVSVWGILAWIGNTTGIPVNLKGVEKDLKDCVSPPCSF